MRVPTGGRTAAIVLSGLFLSSVGAVVGTSTASAGPAAPSPRYRFVAVPALGSNVFGTYNNAAGVDAAGKVVGSSSVPNGARAYSWRDGRLTNLGSLHSGLSESGAAGVSEGGLVVGATQVEGPGDTGQHAFVVRRGSLVDLGTGYRDHRSGSVAVAANDAGLIVGYHYETQPAPRRAVIWRNGKLSELPDLGGDAGSYGDTSLPTAINATGQVVGRAVPRAAGQAPHGVLWDHGRVVDLGNLGSTAEDTTANDINDLSVVVGRSWTGQAQHAFVWRDGVMRALPGLGPDDAEHSSEATGINDSGVVVGYSRTSTATEYTLRATVWRNGKPTDLNTIVSGLPAGQRLETATAINDGGTIVGEVCWLQNGRCDGHSTAYALVPLG